MPHYELKKIEEERRALHEIGITAEFAAKPRQSHRLEPFANAIDKGLTPGMFMVHKCVPPEEEVVAYYHSPRVDFSRTAL